MSINFKHTCEIIPETINANEELFLNEILEDEKNNIISSEQAEKIIEIGLNVLK